MSIIGNYAGILPYVAIAFVLLYVYKVIHDLLTPFDDVAEMERGNAAPALARAGAYLGVVIAMSGSLILSEQSYGNDLLAFAADGLIALAVFTVACRLFDRLFLPHVDNADQVGQGNLAVAIMEAFGYVALGVIMSAAFSGDGLNFWGGILSALVFSAIGLGSLTAIYLGYGFFWKRRGRAIDTEIGSGDLTTAVDSGTLLLAMSVTLWFSISGDYTGWGNDLGSYASAAVVSVVAVVLSRVLARMLVARSLREAGYYVHQGNLAKSTIIGAASIGTGFLSGLVVFM